MTTGFSSAIKVLIVEDHIIYRIGLKLAIESLPNHQVIGEAGEGQQAILLAQELKPDVIIMDVSMPLLGSR
ncbi:MAG: response regulator transcription factor [Candidatus Obscuribacterales bacterium]|nr:response regulator transcription factor [Candidatus Obscuribacterales bacterium]